MAFDPHPLAFLRPDQAPARLTGFPQRERLLMAAGADRVVRLEPTPDLLALSAGEFLERVCRDWRPVAFVEGPDFRFGKGRGGDVDFLRERARHSGFDVEVVQPVTVTLADHTVAPASSTLARWLIAGGRMSDAAIVLGRSYELAGVVVQGDRRGRTIGFPTANLRTDGLPPADGVYAAEAILDDGRVFTAAVSIGTKPTFGAGGRAAEALLLDAPADGAAVAGLPEYGWNLTLRFIAWVREQVQFHSVGALVEQMHRDCTRIRALRPSPLAAVESRTNLETAACP
jgi:riboflavin kinase/FMN adenylyltransferase